MDISRFVKYLSNQATPEEKKRFFDDLEQNKELENEFLSAKKIWDILQINHIQISDNRKKALFVSFWKKKDAPKGVKHPVEMFKFWRYAAAVFLVIALPLTYYFGFEQGKPTNAFTTISCALGDRTSVYLPDNSKVYLNSGSKLIFNTNFGNGKREVFLEGEAFFSVTENIHSPFTVNADVVKIEVLGTEFNVKAYPEEEKISSTLTKGSLRINHQKRGLLLTPGQKFVYSKSSHATNVLTLNDTAPETEWKDGRLVFRNESLEELELKLERWFDVDIVLFDDQVKQRRFTGILERESILEAVSYLGISRHVGYKIEGNEITFYTKNL